MPQQQEPNRGKKMQKQRGRKQGSKQQGNQQGGQQKRDNEPMTPKQ